ncbi:MAG: phosphate ABC transporter substrate-binding protein [Candidatus Thorarchaeota archaeon]
MSFQRKKWQTIFLIIMIPVAGVFGWLLAWSSFNTNMQYEINIEGSTTVEKILENSTKAFTESHPNVQVTLTGTGSSAGITALTNDLVDIAMTSRPIEDSENQTANNELKEIAIAKDVLVLIINSEADPLDISLNIARAIFNGTITEWSNPLVSSANLLGSIQLVVREAGSGTRDFFNEFVMGDVTQSSTGSTYPSTAVEKTSSHLMLEAISANPSCIGYIGLGFLSENVDAVKINGVEPKLESVKNGSYTIQRNLFLVTKGALLEGSIIREFINYSLSPEGQKIVQETGFVPIIEIIDRWD